MNYVSLCKEDNNFFGSFHEMEAEYFEHLPAIAVLCNLSQFQSSVRNAESEVITYLEQEIDAGSISFNKVEAIVIPEKTYFFSKGDTAKIKTLGISSHTVRRDNWIGNIANTFDVELKDKILLTTSGIANR